MKKTLVFTIGIMPSFCLVGCINIKAPDKPIEINLNVNIKQEVVVKLQKDAQDLITSNPELFPQ
ncbi:hypothetical protein BH09PSE3_BH09PSE3_24310 [soil metagenome]